MYRSAPIFSSPSTYPENSCTDFGIYGIEQNDCYLDLNCIEPSLLPGMQQTLTYSTAYNNNTTTSSSSSSNTVLESTNPATNRTSRRTIRKKRSKRDPNEPQKPVSAYALFFRDTQAAIKGRSPNASFGEVSKIVASMWDALDCSAKNLYKQRTETAKKDYLKKLAAYRAQQISRNESVQSVPEKEHLITKSQNCCATSSNLEQQPSFKMYEMGEMTLASLIARPPIDKSFISKPASALDPKNR